MTFYGRDDPGGQITRRLEDARAGAKTWSAARPRTAKRNAAAAAAIEAYVEVDALLANGYPVPAQWARSVALPSVDELAEALVAMSIGMGPLDSYPVKVIAEKLHGLLARRRAPRVPFDEPARATVVVDPAEAGSGSVYGIRPHRPHTAAELAEQEKWAKRLYGSLPAPSAVLADDGKGDTDDVD